MTKSAKPAHKPAHKPTHKPGEQPAHKPAHKPAPKRTPKAAPRAASALDPLAKNPFTGRADPSGGMAGGGAQSWV